MDIAVDRFVYISLCFRANIGSERASGRTIRGMVVDGDSKYPIPYATVRLSDKEGMGTTTDSPGTFHHSAGSRRETYGRGSVHGI